jgi:hypothetical protein
VTVKAGRNQDVLNNEFGALSARTFDVENTRRFAGSRNDPSRMAANFAGVVGNNDARNDSVIRGNSPTGLLWRLEGIDIPNPSHYGALGATGGPVTILNNNVLSQSDFFTGAFSATYGNALSGVFDLQLKTGNRDKREYTGQVGFNGFELEAEGPFKKRKKETYLAHYRYLVMGLVQKLGISMGTGSSVPNYQDLSFKIDIPTKKAGSRWSMPKICFRAVYFHRLSYDLLDSTYSNKIYRRLRDENGGTELFQAYGQWQYKPLNELTINGGLHFTYFNLNKKMRLSRGWAYVMTFLPDRLYLLPRV